MWSIEASDEYLSRAKKFAKRHRQAFAATHDNLATYHEALMNGGLVRDLGFGFVHNEPKGIKAIDQKGAAHATELRLYIYPEPLEQVIYLLTIGDKNSQSDDIQNCSATVDEIKKRAKEKNG